MEANDGKQPRKRSLTDLTLSWIAERVRKMEEIKQKVQSGNLKVESDKVARSILSAD